MKLATVLSVLISGSAACGLSQAQSAEPATPSLPATGAAPGAVAPLSAATSTAASTAAPAAAPTAVAPIAQATVAAALAALKARDGDGVIVTQADGWLIVNEVLASAQWSFVPAGHAAYPAVVRRVIRRGAGGAVSVDTTSLCEAAAEPCAKLLAEFEALNSRITQAVKARGRQGSSASTAAPSR
ncbi:MAG: hypothetical protein AB9M60_16430 [Leptothrix sp. (in: b-proteobacteria)]